MKREAPAETGATHNSTSHNEHNGGGGASEVLDELYDGAQRANAVPGGTPERPEDRKTPAEPASLSEKVFRLDDRKAPGKVPALALESDILGRFKDDLYRAGVAGEERLACLTYLALTSRVLPWGKASARPISLLAKGTSSTGKSHTTQAVLRFFPPEAYINLGSISRRYLFYTEEAFKHRHLVVPEWATIKEDDELVAMLRVLLSEGRLIHGTVEGEGKKKATRIEKRGPTGLLVTTTETAVDLEMETRCLLITTDDTPEQTRNVFKVIAELEEQEMGVDFGPWQELQTWIAEQGEARVVIPFVAELAALMPSEATRLRRDFVSLLCLVRAHAILYQAQRELDPKDGRLIATVEGDYAPVLELVSEVIAEAADASVSPETRETVEAVGTLIAEEEREYVSVKALTDRLALGQSATYDRVKRALRGGYLVNVTRKDERGYKLAVGAEMPGDGSFLPLPEEVFRAFSGRPTGKAKPHDQSESEEFSGVPVIPVDPQEDTERFCPECERQEWCAERVLCWDVIQETEQAELL